MKLALYDGGMGNVAKATRHAGDRYQRVFRALSRPLRAIEDEAHPIHGIERKGERADTPFIAMFGLVLFLFPIFLLMLGLAAVAVYLFV